MVGQIDRMFMLRAVRLAEQGMGLVAPNPLVGAVLVRGQNIIAEGWHQRYGGPHAEAMALVEAGSAARGATLYCSLEPCCFRSSSKKQPPCCEHIIAAGVKRVVIANIDPYSQVSGRGLARLRQAGVEVELGVEAEAAAQLNQGFFTRVTYARPFVLLKVAQSLDGCLACDNGQSRWITDQPARELAHRLRLASDAVLVGSETALADDPQLTVRLPGHLESCPLRVVVDRRLRLPLTLRLFCDQWRERTLLVSSDRHPAESFVPFQNRGITVLPLPDTGQFLQQLCSYLAAERGCNQLLVEGGAQLHASLVAAGLYDQMVALVAPILLGGRASMGKLDLAQVSDAPRLCQVCYQSLGEQLVVSGWRAAPLVPGGSVTAPWRLPALRMLGAAL